MPLTRVCAHNAREVMHGGLDMATGSRGESWTRWMWGGAVALLLLPFVAMRFTAEVNWGALDFLVIGLMLAALCGLIELTVRRSSKGVYRWAMGLAAIGGFLVIWANLAVGIVASENNPYNLIFFGIVLAAIIAGFVVRARPGPMAKILAVTALAMPVAVAVGQMAGSDELHDTRIAEWIAVTMLAGVFALSAVLFRRAEG